MNEIEQEVFDAIRAAVMPVHARAIADQSGLDRADVSRAVYVLRNEGIISQVGEEKLKGKGGRNVPVYSACDIDAALAEAICGAEDQYDSEAALDEPQLPDDTYEDEAPQAMQIAEYEQSDEDPVCRAIERLSMFCAIPDGRARATRLRALAEKLKSVSSVVAADLLESASILEDLDP